MDPTLATHLTLLEASLFPYVRALSSIKSCNGAVVFLRDKHYRDHAVSVASVATDIDDSRLAFVESQIEGHRVDLTATTLGETFATHESKIMKSRMNPRHTVWGVDISLPHKQDAVVQLAFEHPTGLPTSAALLKIWDEHKDDVIYSLKELVSYDTPSIADECRALPPVTPNAYVIKWDIADSSHSVATNYGEFRHFIVAFMTAVNALVAYHGGEVTSYGGDGQNIVVPIPPTIDVNNATAVRIFGTQRVVPLIDKIIRTHQTLAVNYQTIPRLNIALGLDHVETSQYGEVTGPIFWRLASKLKTLSSSGDFVNFVVDDSAKHLA